MLGSPEVFAAAEDDASPVDAFSGAGVPERGDPVESEWEGPAGRPRGSAECWRFSCDVLVDEFRATTIHIP